MTIHCRHRWLACLLTLALPRGAHADVDEALIQRLQQRALADTDAFDIARRLVEEVGPRFAGSAGDRAAVAWALAELRRAGFENVRAEPVTVPRWERGAARVELLTPGPETLAAVALGGSVATPDGGIEAEVVAATSLAELATLPAAQVAGRIVYLLDRMQPTRDVSGYVRAVPIRSRGVIEAARRGALGVVIRSVGTSPDGAPHTGQLRYAAGVPRIPGLALSAPAADRLEQQLAAGPVRLRLRNLARCAAPAESANVIGELRGRERPDEIVLLGAHLDSWDISPGAQDDATGVATVIRAARLIAEAGPRTRRSIRVVLYANEEFGGEGGDAYALGHAAEHHVGALEADLGSGRVYGFATRLRSENLRLGIGWARLLAPLRIAYLGNQAGGGSDLDPLLRQGVPVFDLAPDASRYFDVHHSAQDTLEHVDREGLAQNVAAYATLAYLLAETTLDPGRAGDVPPDTSAPTLHPCQAP